MVCWPFNQFQVKTINSTSYLYFYGGVFDTKHTSVKVALDLVCYSYITKIQHLYDFLQSCMKMFTCAAEIYSISLTASQISSFSFSSSTMEDNISHKIGYIVFNRNKFYSMCVTLNNQCCCRIKKDREPINKSPYSCMVYGLHPLYMSAFLEILPLLKFPKGKQVEAIGNQVETVSILIQLFDVDSMLIHLNFACAHA